MTASNPVDDRSPIRQQRWCDATVAQAIPAYGLCAVANAAHDATGETQLVVDLPTSSTLPALCGALGVQPGVSGHAQVTLDFPTYVQYEAGDGTPANGEEWGPESGNYKLRKGKPGFLICGDPTSGVGSATIVKVQRNSGSGLIRFELTSNLDLAGTASAKLLDIAWNDTGTTITVRDPYSNPGCWQGYTGYRGFAVLGASGIYDVVWMERRALIIEFTLTQDTNLGSGTTATVNEYHQQGDKNPGSTVLVYDHLELYPKALNGAKGLAHWNDRRKRYEVIICQQMGTLFYASANSNFCPTDTTVSGTYLGKYQHSPFNQAPNPTPTTFRNYYGLAGKSGDKLAIRYDFDADTWDIVQVTPHQVEAIINLTYDSTTCSIKGDKQKFYAYICETSTNETLLALTQITYVENVAQVHVAASSGVVESCVITEVQKTACVFGTSAPNPGTSTIMTFAKTGVVDNVYKTGMELDQEIIYLPILVGCFGQFATQKILDFTVCNSSGSSQ